MSFLVNWWLGYRRRTHRRSFVLFAAAGVACSVLLLGGAHVLLSRPAGTPVRLALPASQPDFVSLLPSADGELDRSVVRLPNDRLESYVVGFRGPEGPALGLVTKGLVGYRVVALLDLPGAASAAPAFPSVYLWPGTGDQPRVVAVIRLADGWSAAYVVLANQDGLKIVERQTPMSDVPPQYVAVGEVGESLRTARFGDLDGDGTPDELLTEIRQGSQPPRYEAYALRDGQLAWRQDLIDTLQQTAGLFIDTRADVGGMLVIEGVGADAQPTVMGFPLH
jgi:hypothetical protein